MSESARVTKAVLSQYIPKNVDAKNLTTDERDMCELYLRTGSRAAAKRLMMPSDVARHVKSSGFWDRAEIKNYISDRRKQMLSDPATSAMTQSQSESLNTLDALSQKYDTHRVYYDTIQVLTQIITACVPPAATTPDQMCIDDALAAISERNKMMGLYAPEKSINVQLGYDSDRIIKALEVAEKEYERDY